jgi:DNA-binding transcriptional LysR family regulator
MAEDLNELRMFLAVARSGGFREAARVEGGGASRYSEAVRRLESRLGLRLFHRTTRSVALTEAGREFCERVGAALCEVDAAIQQAASIGGRPAGALRLNVPVVAARLVLPRILPAFLEPHPLIRVEVTAQEQFVDILAAGFDAGIRYEERLEQDMIALPIGPRRQRFAIAASPGYFARRGVPASPDDLARHACLRSRSSAGLVHPWRLERGGEALSLDLSGPLDVVIGGASQLLIDAALAGLGLVFMFEDWLAPHLRSGDLAPALEDWWPSFSGPFLYYSGRRLLPASLRAFVDFVKTSPLARWDEAPLSTRRN